MPLTEIQRFAAIRKAASLLSNDLSILSSCLERNLPADLPEMRRAAARAVCVTAEILKETK